ncbi:MAG: DUF4405 domain-containing protein [Methylomicrobium sp.]|nr:DUF4405 domain-containing protein [Methylomicrobium sp.]
MKQTRINYLIDIIAFAGFVFLTTTGVLLRYLLPPGSGRTSTLMGLDRHEWGTVHFWISVVFFSVLALHLIVHWRWIAGVFSGRASESSGLRLGLGVVGILTLVAIGVAPLLVPVENSDSHVRQGAHSENLDIYGAMTLRELEQASGVPADYVLSKLGLPDTVSKEEKLGQLKRKYGFELASVRNAIKSYRE